MESVLLDAIDTAQKSEAVYTKFISANDVGKTSHGESRSHQAGFYIAKTFLPHVFETEIQKGQDYEQYVTIRWQDDFETDSRFKYYGSKNECHLTRMGKDFPFRFDDNIGDLLIICKQSKEYYRAFVLNTDDDIEEFFAALYISPANANGVVVRQEVLSSEERLMQCFASFIKGLNADFPSTEILADHARNCYNDANGLTKKDILTNPDKVLIKWIESEYELFKALENNRYSGIIKTPFKNVESLVKTANMILNRRKSRAGKSLEHHLSQVFQVFGLIFSAQAVTEGNKKPDFLFPGGEAYHNSRFPIDKLVFLASKTTCKDRWRQILNEADRVKKKHLFTLQQGISSNQLKEIYSAGVRLVVPKAHISSFPEQYRSEILDLGKFVDLVKSRQS